jgi:hypothetical protein
VAGPGPAGTDGWRLGAVTLEPDGGPPKPARTRTVIGRVPLTTALGDAFAAAVSRWLVEETQRDKNDQGEADPATQRALADLGTAADGLDLVGAALDGVRQALLGLGSSIVRRKTADGTAIPMGPPDLLTGGTVELRRIRLVDAFGRTAEPSVDDTRVPARLAVLAGSPPRPRPAALLCGPRFTAPARCRLRLRHGDRGRPGQPTSVHDRWRVHQGVGAGQWDGSGDFPVHRARRRAGARRQLGHRLRRKAGRRRHLGRS